MNLDTMLVLARNGVLGTVINLLDVLTGVVHGVDGGVCGGGGGSGGAGLSVCLVCEMGGLIADDVGGIGDFVGDLTAAGFVGDVMSGVGCGLHAGFGGLGGLGSGFLCLGLDATHFDEDAGWKVGG